MREYRLPAVPGREEIQTQDDVHDHPMIKKVEAAFLVDRKSGW
jgi:hypothetical protein